MDSTIQQELVLLNVEAKDKFDLLEQLACHLQKLGYVKDSYKDAVIAREKVFATGLPTIAGGVAIPHTDAEHVNEPAICFARLTKPVDFDIMGDDEETVSVDLVVMLAMKEPHAQIDLLQNLMGVFQDEDALTYLKTQNDKQSIVNFIKERVFNNSAE